MGLITITSILPVLVVSGAVVVVEGPGTGFGIQNMTTIVTRIATRATTREPTIHHSQWVALR